jgi:carbamoyltransferase
MGEITRVTDLAARVVPAVVHVDGTARPQTVPGDWPAASFRRLIERFRDITGVPMVVNTSFNVRDEPIVCTPEDALRCFAASGLEQLFLGPFLVHKGNRHV